MTDVLDVLTGGKSVSWGSAWQGFEKHGSCSTFGVLRGNLVEHLLQHRFGQVFSIDHHARNPPCVLDLGQRIGVEQQEVASLAGFNRSGLFGQAEVLGGRDGRERSAW